MTPKNEALEICGETPPWGNSEDACTWEKGHPEEWHEGSGRGRLAHSGSDNSAGPGVPLIVGIARRIAEYTQADILTPHGMYDELRCFFCGADEEAEHKEDCIWKLAKDAAEPRAGRDLEGPK